MRLGHFRRDSDLEAELQIHLEMQTEENLAAGMMGAEARRRARIRLGGTTALIERVRDQELITTLEGWFSDFTRGLRALRKSPVFSLTAVLTLAFAIGSNIAIFSLLYGLLLRSLPVPEPERLTNIGIALLDSHDNQSSSQMPYQMLQHLRRQQISFTDVFGWLGGLGVTITDNEGSLRLYQAGLITGNGFATLGAKPHLGRLIQDSDDVRGGPASGWSVVLDYAYWRERFGSDSQILGKKLTISGIPVTVVGVTQPEFRGLEPGAEIKLYLPFAFVTPLIGRDIINARTSSVFCSAVGRLRPEVTVAQAGAELASYQARLFRTFIALEDQHFLKGAKLRLISARSGLPSYFSHLYTRPLGLMQALAAIVLLLCCVNVAGLMMSKIYSRQREFALRTAIGAARWRLVRQYLTESFVIALTGALLGAAGAWFGSPALLRFFRDPNMAEGMDVRPDSMFFWATGLLAVAVTLIFGGFPAWKIGGSDPGILLKSRTASAARRRTMGQMFVPVQVALSLVLVTLAALLSQSLAHLRTERTGFDLDHVTIQTPPFDLLPQKGDAKLELYQRMADRIEQMPGIRSAAVTWFTPMSGGEDKNMFAGLTKDGRRGQESQMAFNTVGAGYFRTMGTRVFEGREFQRTERNPKVCVVNHSAGHLLFPHQNAIGRYVRIRKIRDLPDLGKCRVVGVVEDAKFADLRDHPPPTIYFPLWAKMFDVNGNLVFLINAPRKEQAISGYRAALSELAPTVPVVLFVTLREQMDAALGSERLITTLSNLFGALSLGLSAIGLYGLLSSGVAQRTGEIGIRMALGAPRNKVLRMILWEALALMGAGLLLGSLLLLLTAGFVRNLFYGVSQFDLTTWIATATLLTALTVLAGLSPALRAASIDPSWALRTD